MPGSVRFRRRIVGTSVEGRPIEAYADLSPRRSSAPGVGLLFGAIHGDEPMTAYVLRRLVDALDGLERGRRGRAVVIIPVVNPDGLARRMRRNARGVDLNRNFPTRDWSPGPSRRRNYGGPRPLSEPESRALHRLVLRLRPRWIVAVHTINRGRFCNNYDGRGRALAQAFSRINGYPVTTSIGYPTPGSFGTWAGRERGIPVLTLELPSHHSRQCCWADNAEAFMNLLRQPGARALSQPTSGWNRSHKTVRRGRR